MAPLAAVLKAPGERGILRAWVGLGVLALGLAGAMAPLLALSRLPGAETALPWPSAFFQKSLVVHVIFSFVVWILAVFAALMHLGTLRLAAGRPPARWLGQSAIALAGIAFALLFVPALRDAGDPTLNNYVPAITDPLYYAGLVALALSLLTVGSRLVASLADRRGPWEPITWSALAGAAIFVLAVAAIGLALTRLGNRTPSFDFNEDLFWGGGHVLQFLNTVLMMAAWYVLGGISLGRPALRPRIFGLALLLLVAGAAAGFAFETLLPPFSATSRLALTNLQYALAPPVLLVAAAGAREFLVARGASAAASSDRDAEEAQRLARISLFLSVAVFALGGFLGLFVDGGDTRTPAHYHGVIGGINLAFMGLVLVLLLPLLGRSPWPSRLLALQLWLYGSGQALACLGLFWAGGYGAPRKTVGAGSGIAELGAKLGLYLNGAGMLIAVVGGVLFIWTAGRALLRRAE